MKGSFKDTAVKARAAAEACDKLLRKFTGVETREYLCETLTNCIDICNRCAAECESNSMNVRPAIECADICHMTADCCNYFGDEDSLACSKIIKACEDECRKLF